MQKILLAVLLFTLYLFLNPAITLAQEVCVPGEHTPNPNDYTEVENPDPDTNPCPAETYCYVTFGSTYRCYNSEGATTSQVDTPPAATDSDTCTALESITFTPNPVEARKDLVIQGKIQNCPGIGVEAIFIDIENLDTGETRNGLRSVRTENDSSFLIDKFSMDTPGRWQFKFRYNMKGRILTSDQAIVQVNQSTKTEYSCGDTVTDRYSTCPAKCPAVQVGEIVKCGAQTSNEVSDQLCKAHIESDAKTDVETLPTCYNFSNRTAATKCSNEDSYICIDPEMSMCRDTDGLVYCGIKEIDPAHAGGIPCDPKDGRILDKPPSKAQIADDVGLTRGSQVWNFFVYGGLNPATLGTAAIRNQIEVQQKLDEANRIYNEQVASLPRGVMTAVGCVPTEPKPLVEGILRYGSLAVGGIAFLIMLLGAIQMITAEGNPESIKKAQEKFYSAIIGLLFVIFSVLLMQVIGVDILDLPGFSR